MDQKRNKIPQLIERLYKIVAELESLFPGRKFTPDGHLVGSLGEVIAAHDYDLILLEASTKTHDARKGGKQIQIKATQGKASMRLQRPWRFPTVASQLARASSFIIPSNSIVITEQHF